MPKRPSINDLRVEARKMILADWPIDNVVMALDLPEDERAVLEGFKERLNRKIPLSSYDPESLQRKA